MVNSADRRSASKPKTLNHRRRSQRGREREKERERGRGRKGGRREEGERERERERERRDTLVYVSWSSLVVPMNKQIQISSEGARCVNHHETCYT